MRSRQARTVRASLPHYGALRRSARHVASHPRRVLASVLSASETHGQHMERVQRYSETKQRNIPWNWQLVSKTGRRIKS